MRVVLAAAVAAVLAVATDPARAADSEAVQHLVDEGRDLFQAARFDEALTRYEAAFERSGANGLVYMIGRCHQELGHEEQALAAFERFLAGEGPEEAKARAREYVAAHRSRAPESPPPAPPPPPLGSVPKREPTATPSPPVTVAAVEQRHPYSPWTWVTLGTGVAMLATGTVCYVLGEADHREITSAGGWGTGVSQMTEARAKQLEESGDAKKIAGGVLWGVGGAAVATSVVLFVLDARDGAPERPALRVLPTEGGGLFALHGRF